MPLVNAGAPDVPAAKGPLPLHVPPPAVHHIDPAAMQAFLEFQQRHLMAAETDQRLNAKAHLEKALKASNDAKVAKDCH